MAEPNALATVRAEDALDLVSEAERAILAATTATEAEEVWRRVAAVEEAARIVKAASDVQAAWARTKLRAERRWGELLGPATGPGPSVVTHGHNPAQRKAVQRVREVASRNPHCKQVVLDVERFVVLRLTDGVTREMSPGEYAHWLVSLRKRADLRPAA